MSLTAWIARLLGYRHVAAVDEISPALSAPWAHDNPWLVVLGVAACLLAAVLFYLRGQPQRSTTARTVLAISRAVLLVLVLLCLAEPTLVLKFTSHPRPLLWLLFDGTDSMAIEDDLTEAERSRLAEACGLADKPPAERQGASAEREPAPRHSRSAYLQALLARPNENLLARLEEKYRLKAFKFDRPDGVTSLKLSSQEGQPVDAPLLVGQLTTGGQVTALGAALADLAQRHATSNLAGVVVFSDFDQNSGPPALAAARQLGVPLYEVGIGPAAAVDLAVELQAPLLLKKAERTSLPVTLRQNGFDGQAVTLRLTARRLGDSATPLQPLLIDQRSVTLTAPELFFEVPFEPAETGRFVLAAEVEPLEGEVIKQNNRSQREVSIRDDFLRLMFVENEPTWEWRFIKEVFHRDRLVGMRGFRTFLRSADPKVRQTNELFLGTMTPARSDFFANDVIFLGDMPAGTLNTRFCEMLKEFVKTFGGGLVILSGPTFGPGQLAATPLADMLPVVVDSDARYRDARPFSPRLTPYASQFDFMQLGGGSPAENEKAWSNLGELPWYQPVARVHPFAKAVLLEHPTDTCVDGRTRQPLIAVRRYGNGEVVYLAFDETWRLRRKYGEMYYRQFWGQMIHRLGLSHALGTQKRFVARTDRQQYQADDKVLLTVDAYDENFEPLIADKLADHKLWGELVLPPRSGGPTPATSNPLASETDNRQPLSISQLRPGVFEAQIPVFAAGEHRIKIKDPITKEFVEVNFQVTSLSAERRSAVRNVALEDELAAVSDGKTYDLTTVSKLPDEIRAAAKAESSIEVFPLWNTWACFTLVVLLMLGEWLLRKLVNLP